jgi:hypothetical protein
VHRDDADVSLALQPELRHGLGHAMRLSSAP